MEKMLKQTEQEETTADIRLDWWDKNKPKVIGESGIPLQSQFWRQD